MGRSSKSVLAQGTCVHMPARYRRCLGSRSRFAIVAGTTESGFPMTELQDLTALIRANTALIVIETPDEARVVELFRQSLLHVWRALFRWSITEGLRRIDLDREDPSEVAPDASSTLQAIRDADQRGIYLLLDFHHYLDYASTQRALREIVQRRDCQPHVLVLVGTKIELPPELEPLAVRFTPRLPDAH